MKKARIFLILIIFSLNSCAFMFNEAVFPNQCMKCQVVNEYSGEVLWSEQGCGGETAGLRDKAKVKAYDLSRNGFDLCDLEVKCTRWKKDPEDESSDTEQKRK